MVPVIATGWEDVQKRLKGQVDMVQKEDHQIKVCPAHATWRSARRSGLAHPRLSPIMPGSKMQHDVPADAQHAGFNHDVQS